MGRRQSDPFPTIELMYGRDPDNEIRLFCNDRYCLCTLKFLAALTIDVLTRDLARFWTAKIHGRRGCQHCHSTPLKNFVTASHVVEESGIFGKPQHTVQVPTRYRLD